MESNSKKKNSAIKDRIKRLLESQKLADIHFLVGKSPNDRVLPSHKLILSLASPVFEEMFYGDKPIEEDLVIVPDIDPEAFKTMLEYIYSDRKKLNTFEQAFQVYYAARKYSLTNLMNSCIIFLISKLKPSNACQAYEFGQYFHEESLMATSMEIIKTNTMEVLEDNNFLNISPCTLMAILDQQKLNMDSELDLFKAVQRYANARVYLLKSSPIKPNEECQKKVSNNLEDAEQECLISENSTDNTHNLMHLVQEIKVEKNVEGSLQDSHERGEDDEGMISAGSSFVSTENGESSDASHSGDFPNHPLTYSNALVHSQTNGTTEALCNTENLFNETEQTLVNSDITLTNSFINTESTIISANNNLDSPHESTIDENNNSKNNNKNVNGTKENNEKIERNKNNENDNNDNPKCSDNLGDIVSHILSKKRLPVSEEIIRKAVKKIRFLTLTPQEFVKGPALSKLLKRDEAFAILVNIIEKMDECPMPEGFCAY